MNTHLPDLPLDMADDCVLAVHGGAGVLSRELFHSRELSHKSGNEDECRAALEAALQAGYAVLMKPESQAKDATSVDAVVAAVCVLEDAPCFNAGRARPSPATARSNSTPRSWTAPPAAPAPWHA